jgi:hypothetical protein
VKLALIAAALLLVIIGLILRYVSAQNNVHNVGDSSGKAMPNM